LAFPDWGVLERHRHEVGGFFLPTYAPSLNPDELLNREVKANTLGRLRPANRTQLTAGVRSCLRPTQRRPDVLRNTFRHEPVRYAA